MLEEIKEAVAYIQNKISATPEMGIVLGTGLGNLGNQIETTHVFEYKEIPNFPISTVSGHQGKLIFGSLEGMQVVALQGRFHYYEGYPMNQVTFPIRVLKLLGIQTLLLSNASGGVNQSFSVGDIMLITDHINLFPDNPLRGKNIEAFGPRFPDMSEPYDKNLLNFAQKVAVQNGIELQTGVYAGTSGPTFETPAEYKYMKAIGADAVGMSTVPEVIVARHMGLPCIAFSVITDMGGTDEIEEVSHEMVLDVATQVEPKVTNLVKQLIKNLKAN